MSRNPITKQEAEFYLDQFLSQQNVPYVTLEEADASEYPFRATAREMLSSIGGAIFTFTSGIWGDDATVDAHRPYQAREIKVVIGWSSTHRSVASAVAALDSYTRAVAFAAKLQAFVDQLPEILKEDK